MSLLLVAVLVLEASHVLTIFAVGLDAPLHAAAIIVREPRHLLRVFLSMGVIMPVLAVLAVASFELLPEVKLALVALAVSPVPPIILHRTHDERHYPMALFLTMCVLSPVLAPLTFGIAAWTLHKDVGFSPLHLLPMVGLAIVAPLVAGWGLRRLLPAAQRAAKPISRIANWGLVLSIAALLVERWPAVFQLVGNGTILAFATFSLVGLAVGHRLGGPGLERRAALGLATACRHPAIAVEIAHATFPGNQAAGPAVIGYVIVSVLCAVPYLFWERHRKLLSASGAENAVVDAQ